MCNKDYERHTIALLVQWNVVHHVRLTPSVARYHHKRYTSRAGLAELAAAAQYVPRPFTSATQQQKELLALRTATRAYALQTEQ